MSVICLRHQKMISMLLSGKLSRRFWGGRVIWAIFTFRTSYDDFDNKIVFRTIELVNKTVVIYRIGPKPTSIKFDEKILSGPSRGPQNKPFIRRCKGNSKENTYKWKFWKKIFTSFDLSEFWSKISMFYMKKVLFYHIFSTLTSVFAYLKPSRPYTR